MLEHAAMTALVARREGAAGAKVHKMPCHHDLDAAYGARAQQRTPRAAVPAAIGRPRQLSRKSMRQADVYRMIAEEGACSKRPDPHQLPLAPSRRNRPVPR